MRKVSNALFKNELMPGSSVDSRTVQYVQKKGESSSTSFTTMSMMYSRVVRCTKPLTGHISTSSSSTNPSPSKHRTP